MIEFEDNTASNEYESEDREWVMDDLKKVAHDPRIAALIEDPVALDQAFVKSWSLGLEHNRFEYLYSVATAPEETLARLDTFLSRPRVNGWGHPVEKDQMIIDFISYEHWRTLGYSYQESIDQAQAAQEAHIGEGDYEMGDYEAGDYIYNEETGEFELYDEDDPKYRNGYDKA